MKGEENYQYQLTTQPQSHVFEVNKELDIPEYLDESYWWAYLHPKGVKFFDKSWVVNGILFGNYSKLRDNILGHLNAETGDILQIAAVYGNISTKIAEKISNKNRLDVVDVAPIQLQNLSKKINGYDNIRLMHQDASQLNLPKHSYETVLLFFLLHEVPDEKKRKILEQSLQMVKPGGQILIVDYHKPGILSPFRYLMKLILTLLEPYACSLWEKEIAGLLPEGTKVRKITKQTFFTGLYQQVTIDV